jgi:hypothetical protein
MEVRLSDQNLPSREETEKRVNRLKAVLAKLESRLALKQEKLRREIEKIPENKRKTVDEGLKWLKETYNQHEAQNQENTSRKEESC